MTWTETEDISWAVHPRRIRVGDEIEPLEVWLIVTLRKRAAADLALPLVPGRQLCSHLVILAFPFPTETECVTRVR